MPWTKSRLLLDTFCTGRKGQPGTCLGNTPPFYLTIIRLGFLPNSYVGPYNPILIILDSYENDIFFNRLCTGGGKFSTVPENNSLSIQIQIYISRKIPKIFIQPGIGLAWCFEVKYSQVPIFRLGKQGGIFAFVAFK